jgi:hypothetical protein
VKPYKRKRRTKKYLITYKRLLIATWIGILSYAWYLSCDTVETTTKTNLKEDIQHVR